MNPLSQEPKFNVKKETPNYCCVDKRFYCCRSVTYDLGGGVVSDKLNTLRDKINWSKKISL